MPEHVNQTAIEGGTPVPMITVSRKSLLAQPEPGYVHSHAVNGFGTLNEERFFGEMIVPVIMSDTKTVLEIGRYLSTPIACPQIKEPPETMRHPRGD